MTSALLAVGSSWVMELGHCHGEGLLCRKVCASVVRARRVSRWREGRGDGGLHEAVRVRQTFLRMEVGTRVHLFAGFRHNRLNCEGRNPPLGGDTLWLPLSRFDLVGRSGPGSGDHP